MNDLIKVDQDQLEIFETEVKQMIQRTLDRRTAVFIDPKLEVDKLRYDGVRFSPKYSDLVTLTILLQFSEYFGDFREYVIYEVQEYLDRRLLFPELNACLTSQSICSLVLLNFWHPREIFGNFLTTEKINRVLRLVRLILIKPVKPKKSTFSRGYKDKGSLRPKSSWLPSYDWSLNALQLELDQKRQEYHNSVTFIVRTCGDWVLKNRIISKGGIPSEIRRYDQERSETFERRDQETRSLTSKGENDSKV